MWGEHVLVLCHVGSERASENVYRSLRGKSRKIRLFSRSPSFEKFVGRQRARGVALFEKSSAADYIWKSTPRVEFIKRYRSLYHEKKKSFNLKILNETFFYTFDRTASSSWFNTRIWKKNGADLESCTQFLMRHVNSSFFSCILPKIEIDIC